jgi:adsorption protein B
MTWDVILANYYAALETIAAVVAIAIFISSLDDMFIDVWYWVRRGYRAATVVRNKNYRHLNADQLHERTEQTLAIMVPAWKEYDVIAAMVQNMIEVLDYDHYMIFIGTYVNDPETIEEVERMSRRYKHLRRVEVPHPGPTSKADCLNFLIESIFAYEKEAGVEFAGVVLHDSEDVVHPMEVKFFNYLLPRKGMIQLPVASLEREWYEMVAGTYMDEFAESHAKEMIVRESVSGMVPSAGVGTCFSRKALVALVGSTHNQPFNISSLTEDYDVGMRLSQLGMQSIFGVFPVSYLVRRTAWGSRSKAREVTMQMPLCVREYFPDNFRMAYRQKSRWVLGIGLQSWEQIHWKGRSFAARYLLLHDRKGTVTSFISIFAYLLVFQFILYQLGLETGWWEAHFPSLFGSNNFWRGLLYINAFFLASRVAHRIYFTTALYGVEHGLLSVPRMVVGNFVNAMAVARAWRLFLSYLFRGKRLVWDKTMHEFPTGAQLARKRLRLGELLQSWQAVDESVLARALEKQAASHTPLGRVLVSNGWLDDETLAEAIAYQSELPRGVLTVELVLEHALDMPTDLAVRHRAIMLGKKALRPVLAVASPLSDAAIAELTAALGAEPLQRIVREGEIADSLRMLSEAGGAAPSALTPSVPLLGDMLIERAAMSREAFDAAMNDYRPDRHGRIGDYLVKRGVIGRKAVEQAVRDQREYLAKERTARQRSPA